MLSVESWAFHLFEDEDEHEDEHEHERGPGYGPPGHALRPSIQYRLSLFPET